MFFKNHFGMIVTIVVAIVMGLCMSIAVAVVDGIDINYSVIFRTWSMVTNTVLLVSLLIPYTAWSREITDTMHLKEGTLAQKLVSGILPSIILNTFNTGLVSAASIFFNETIPAELQMNMWIHGFLHDWPIMFLVSYVVSFFAEYVGVSIAKIFVRS